MVKRLVMIAGGTGGHIMPALTVAHALAKQGVAIHWLGSTNGMEQDLVSPHFPLVTIAAGRIRGKGLLTKLVAPLRLTWAIWQAYRALARLKPDLVIAMGGFVAAPGGIAAKLLRKPLLIHEQNAIAGYANRLLAHVADRVLCAYPNAFPAKAAAEVVGNPVSDAISGLPEPAARQLGAKQQLQLLILGGSQGAVAINQLVTRALADFEQRQALAVWHQCGVAHTAQVRQAYAAFAYPARVEGFIEQMATAYQWADLVICRAGALTISELCGSGVGSLLIPYPHAVDNHQWHNAQFLLEQGAAWRAAQNTLTPAILQSYFKQWLADRSVCSCKATKARQLAKPEATQQLVNCALELLAARS